MKLNYKGFFIFIGLLLISMQFSFANEEINIIKPYDKAGYHIFEENGKYGISSDSNDIVIPSTLKLETLDRKLFIVQNDEGLFGVVDNKNNIIVPIKYTKINSELGSDLIVGSRKDHSQVIYWYENDKLRF